MIMTAANVELEYPISQQHADAPAPRRARQNRGDRIFIGGLTGIAMIGPAMILVFIGVLAYGAWPSIKEFGFSFVT